MNAPLPEFLDRRSALDEYRGPDGRVDWQKYTADNPTGEARTEAAKRREQKRMMRQVRKNRERAKKRLAKKRKADRKAREEERARFNREGES